MTTTKNTDAAQHQAASLAALRQVATQREQIEHTAYAAVLEARLSGLPWSKIGSALGTTAQAAHLRYHGKSCNRPGCREHAA